MWHYFKLCDLSMQLELQPWISTVCVWLDLWINCCAFYQDFSNHPQDQGRPPLPEFVQMSRLMTLCTHQEIKESLVTHISKVAGENRAGLTVAPKQLERAGHGDWLSVFLWCLGSGVRVPTCGEELRWCAPNRVHPPGEEERAEAYSCQ